MTRRVLLRRSSVVPQGAGRRAASALTTAAFRATLPAMIDGAHIILYSTSPDADRAFFQDVLRLPSADAGGGWLIFGLPPAEIAVHPSDENGLHQLYLMCPDVEVFVAAMKERGIACGPVERQRWGLLTQVTLPGGAKLGVYQPLHARPEPVGAAKAAKKPARRAARKAAKKPAKKPAPRAAKAPAKRAKPAPAKRRA
jgi:hypothetical protein